MKKVILKHKSGESVDAWIEDGKDILVDSGNSGKYWIHRGVLNNLGYTIEEVVERREFYITKVTYDFAEKACDLGYFKTVNICFYPRKDFLKNLIHVTEIREGELVLSREDVERAWKDEDAKNPHLVMSFKGLCRALGFKEPTE